MFGLLIRSSAASGNAASTIAKRAQPRLILLARRAFSSSAQEFKYLTKEQKDATVWIRLNRPDLHNAFNEDVIAEVTNAFRQVTNDVKELSKTASTSGPSLPRAVVLTGNGPSFSAGADLSWMKKMAKYTKEQNKKDSEQLYDMFHSISSCPVPVIARVNGAALGGGSGLVAACDFAFAVKSAKFGFTEVSLGLIPAVISRFCMDKIGAGHARRYFLTGERFSADEAMRIGLVESTYENMEELDAALEKVLNVISNNSPAAVRAAKQLIYDVTDKQFNVNQPETRDFLSSAIANIRVSEEAQGGLNAFLNKQPVPWLLKKQ